MLNRFIFVFDYLSKLLDTIFKFPENIWISLENSDFFNHRITMIEAKQTKTNRLKVSFWRLIQFGVTVILSMAIIFWMIILPVMFFVLNAWFALTIPSELASFVNSQLPTEALSYRGLIVISLNLVWYNLQFAVIIILRWIYMKINELLSK